MNDHHHQGRQRFLTKWDALCNEQPLVFDESISPIEKMTQLGKHLGEGGRRAIANHWKDESVTNADEQLDSVVGAFWRKIDQFAEELENQQLKSQDLTSRKRQRDRAASPQDDEDEEEQQEQEQDLPQKKVKPTKADDDSIHDRCLQWYKHQPGAQENPETIFHSSFTHNLEALQNFARSSLPTLSAYFKSEQVAKSFLDFVKTQTSNDDDPQEVETKTWLTHSAEAFKQEYMDPNEAVKDFIEYVDECQAEYENNYAEYNSPYISLCQSSGYGKTRLLKEVSKQRKLLYVCVGNEQADIYPKANTKARNFFFLQDDHANDSVRQSHLQERLMHCFWWCLQKDDFTTIDQFGDTRAEFWTQLEADAASKSAKAVSNQDQTLWIAFDEARTLLQERSDGLTDFRILRRALRTVSEQVGRRIFVILVDTKSTIANFTPSREVDKSQRPTTDHDQDTFLFHPYILLSMHDVMHGNSQLKYNDKWSYVTCGRPLWKSYFRPGSEKELFRLAANKLTKGNLKDDDLAALAIVICRTGVYLSPQSSLASELAANYMATLLLCDCRHENFLVTYLSDPVLTIASAPLWYQDGMLVNRGLPALRQKLMHGAVLEGYAGELVGRILLLLGMDKTSREGSYDGEWYKVSDFMENCFGIKGCLEGVDANVGFSHFIPLVNRPSTYQDLERLLSRRGACCLPAGHTGIDLLIPFWKRTSSADVEVSSILIQIKNRKNSVNNEEILEKMQPQECFAKGTALRAEERDNHFVYVIMQIGLVHVVPQLPKQLKLMPNQKWVYSVRGVHPGSFPFLKDNPDLEQHLHQMLKGYLNVEEWMKSDAKNNKPITSPGMVRRKNHVDLLGLLENVKKNHPLST